MADHQPSAELAELLSEAADWHVRSGGIFSPVTGGLVRRWRAAEAQGHTPPVEELQSLAERGRQLPNRIVASPPTIERVADCGDVDLNAIAKGRVVDISCAVAWSDRDRHVGLANLMVNAGGTSATLVRARPPLGCGIRSVPGICKSAGRAPSSPGKAYSVTAPSYLEAVTMEDFVGQGQDNVGHRGE